MENKYDYIKTAEQAIAACLAIVAEREAEREARQAELKARIERAIARNEYDEVEGFYPYLSARQGW